MKALDFLDKVETHDFDAMDLPVYMIETQSDWDNFESKFGHKYVPILFSMVKQAVREDLLHVPIFKVLFINTGVTLTVISRRNKFDKALQYCINHFEETEEFEKCSEALQMIENE